ncbi:Bug family tripartite tricarboxylate transporter substrate binding protein [Roseococcus sp. YIM B11640]|uniref:Bug family tripartite tricarboxylate transporter substrate binding protein n=1 Tax=Roseococcus sp. YIM B11640 TaxID=3133973 RepID=UPI003C799547
MSAPLERRVALAVAGSALFAPALRAQTAVQAQAAWNPSRPITIIVGFPPGGRTDGAARMIRAGMQTALGVPVEVDNRGGESGNSGTEAVMSARPDGHTLLVGNIAPMAINPHTMEGMSLDPREMAPVGMILQTSLILAAHPSIGVRDLAGLRSWIAAQGGQGIPYGSPGTGTLCHLAMELLRERLGEPALTHIPVRGSSAAIHELTAGRVKLLFEGAASLAPKIRSGAVTGILATGATRCPALPQIPTAAEQGLENFSFTSWIGLFAPRKTPASILARLNAALNTTLADNGLRERSAGRGDETGGGPPDTMGRVMLADYNRWGTVARENNIRAED